MGYIKLSSDIRKSPPFNQFSRSPRPRMRGVEGVEQAGGIDLGVDLRRRQGGVAQQFLDRPQVALAGEQVAGEGVAQGVRRRGRGQPKAPRIEATASCTIRGESGPPLAPTKSGPSGGRA